MKLDYAYNPNCLNCSIELKIDNYDFYDTNGSIAIFKVTGYCPCCDASYTWEDRYVIEKHQNLRKIS